MPHTKRQRQRLIYNEWWFFILINMLGANIAANGFLCEHVYLCDFVLACNFWWLSLQHSQHTCIPIIANLCCGSGKLQRQQPVSQDSDEHVSILNGTCIMDITFVGAETRVHATVAYVCSLRPGYMADRLPTLCRMISLSLQIYNCVLLCCILKGHDTAFIPKLRDINLDRFALKSNKPLFKFRFLFKIGMALAQVAMCKIPSWKWISRQYSGQSPRFKKLRSGLARAWFD